MARVRFTANLERHVAAPTAEVVGETVRAALDTVFAANPLLRGYVVDERGALRKHMLIFINGEQIVDRETLSDKVGPTDEIFVLQALSGG
jgi:sulfur-carrier protein